MYKDNKSFGRVTRAAIIARISTKNQDPNALTAQIEFCKKYVETHFNGPFKFTVIASRGSGERLDRRELQQLSDLISNE